MTIHFKRGLLVLVPLVLLFQLPLSTQELVSHKGSAFCGVRPSETVVYECTIVNSTATTRYEITWPDSTTCNLTLVNSRFIGSSDGCNNNLAAACADRIEGDKYISNISITLPNVTSPISSVIVKCLSLSEGILEPVGTATLDIISSDGFSFPGIVQLVTENREEGTCVVRVDSNCTVDDYLLSTSTSCSDCSYNGRVFICSDVPPGENCSFGVWATMYNFTSLESNLVFCSNILDTDLMESIPESHPRVEIIIPVVIIIIVAIAVIVIALIVFIIKRRHQGKAILDESQNHGLTDASLTSANDGGSVKQKSQDAFELRVPATNGKASDDQTDTGSVHQGTTQESAPQVPQDSVDQLHQQMKELKEGQTQMKKDFDEKLKEGQTQMKKDFDEKLHEVKKGNEEMERELNELKTSIEEKIQELNDKTLLLAKKDSEISQLQEVIDQKDRELKIKELEVSQRNTELEITVQKLNQSEGLVELQKTTINDLRIQREKLQKQVDSLHDELKQLKQQVDDMQNNLESTREGNKGERRDEAEQKRIQEALDTLVKALNMKLTCKDTGNGSTQPQAKPIVPEIKVDKQHTELNVAEEASRHQDVKNTAEYKNENGHSTLQKTQD